MLTKMTASYLKTLVLKQKVLLIKLFLFKFNKINQLVAENTIFNNPIPKIVVFESMQTKSDDFINGKNLNTDNSNMSDNSLPQDPTKGKQFRY